MGPLMEDREAQLGRGGDSNSGGAEAAQPTQLLLGQRVRIKDGATSKWEQAFARVNDDVVGEIIEFFTSCNGIPSAVVFLGMRGGAYSRPIDDLEII